MFLESKHISYEDSNLHIESRSMIINPTPFTVDENLHKIGLLDSLRCV